MKIDSKVNINHLWGQLMIEELVRNGVDYFCVSPGSRSTPLTFSLARHPFAKSFVHFDERGCGFHALGFVAASRKPCAIITTSGTAAANLLPAIIEASKKKLPLIVMTSDRPIELRNTGAHQTIEQTELYGKYARWFFDLSCPSTEIPPEFVLTTVDQAVHRSTSHLAGPVHLNCMFREPLSPNESSANYKKYLNGLSRWEKDDRPYTRYTRQKTSLDGSTIKEVVDALKPIKTGVIVVGKLSGPAQQQGVLRLSQALGWPIFPDVSSGLRTGSDHPNLIHYHDLILANKDLAKRFRPEGVIHLGGRITSKRWYAFARTLSLKEYIMVLNHPLRNDPFHSVSFRVEAPIDEFCRKVTAKLGQRKDSQPLSWLRKANVRIDALIERMAQQIQGITELQAVRRVLSDLPAKDALFAASSLPIREVDMFAPITRKKFPIGSNRGASGIDGTIASAVGFSVGFKKRATLIIGDLAFLHDLNSLSMLRGHKYPVIIVLLNNNGGGIFSFLPISRHKKVFERYFATPQDMRFADTAKQFSLDYFNPNNDEELKQDYSTALASGRSALIEIITDRQENVRVLRRIQRNIGQFDQTRREG